MVRRARKNKIDYSEDRLLSVASVMLDDHNYLGALKMLNRNASFGDCGEETYELYAGAFDDMELYEKCINKWFEFIDKTKSRDLTEAHEGLAISYMNLGRDDVSAFYYDKLLKESGAIDEEERAQLLKAFLGDEKNPLKIVYPPAKADFSDEVAKAVSLMRSSNFNGAVEQLIDIPPENPEYINARNYMAMCYILDGRYDEAEEVCLDIIDRDEKNIQAMISYAAVKSERGQKEESVAIAEKLLRIKTDDPEDIYKIATVCCENDMHAEAYETFCRLGYDMQYDFNMLYFKAVAAYNSGLQGKGIEILKELLTIYPNAVIARRILLIMIEGKITELPYYYRLPKIERDANIKILLAFDRMPQSKVETYEDWDTLREVIMWCLDEADSRNDKDMLRAAAGCALKARFDDIVRSILLNAFVGDDIKISMLQKLCERNEENKFGVVICNIYRRVNFMRVGLGRTKKKIFLAAYADLVCRFALIDGDYTRSLTTACVLLYDVLAENKKLSLCTDEATLVAAIFSVSSLKLSEVYNGDICAFFGADPELYKQIMENL